MHGSITIKFELGNDAYNNWYQIAKTLRVMAADARKLLLVDRKQYLDINGNAVATVNVKIKQPKKRKGVHTYDG